MMANEPVSVTLRADQWLILIGWISAHKSNPDPEPAETALLSLASRIDDAFKRAG